MPNPQVSYEELTLVNTVTTNALLNVLEKKGLLTHDEVMREIEDLKRKMDEDVRKN